MVIAHTRAEPGDELSVETEGEYVVLVLEGAAVTVTHEDDTQSVDEYAVVIMPSGASTVRIDAPGTIVRVFGAPTVPHLAARCANADDYADGDPNVAPWAPWPAPPDGEKIRIYRCADYPPEEGRMGRIFRCTTVMVNSFDPADDERDFSRVSPHHHDDFEQIGLVLRGECVHHIRTPWGKDMAEWRDDEHVTVGSPSMVVIPPPTVHTTQSISTDEYVHFDIFSPPRVDFSSQPGWVLNADDYPAPEGLSFEGSVDR